MRIRLNSFEASFFCSEREACHVPIHQPPRHAFFLLHTAGWSTNHSVQTFVVLPITAGEFRRRWQYHYAGDNLEPQESSLWLYFDPDHVRTRRSTLWRHDRDQRKRRIVGISHRACSIL